VNSYIQVSSTCKETVKFPALRRDEKFKIKWILSHSRCELNIILGRRNLLTIQLNFSNIDDSNCNTFEKRSDEKHTSWDCVPTSGVPKCPYYLYSTTNGSTANTKPYNLTSHNTDDFLFYGNSIRIIYCGIGEKTNVPITAELSVIMERDFLNAKFIFLNICLPILCFLGSLAFAMFLVLRRCASLIPIQEIKVITYRSEEGQIKQKYVKK